MLEWKKWLFLIILQETFFVVVGAFAEKKSKNIYLHTDVEWLLSICVDLLL